MGLQFGLEPGFRAASQASLWRIFAAHGLAVGHVGADDAHAADGAGDEALLRIGKERVADDDVGDFALASRATPL